MANPLTLASAEDLAKGREGNRALLSDILSVPQAAYSNATENVQQIGQFAKDMATDPQARERFGQQFAAELKKPISPQDVQNAVLSFAPGGMTLAGMTAYHGTPHKFEPTPENPLGKFNLEKIGTGEGAQAYGHGIYVAESPKVAGEYATILANRNPNTLMLNAHANAKRLVKLAGDEEAAILGLEWPLEHANPNDFNTKLMKETLAIIKNGEYKKPLEKSGNLYHVDVPDTHVEKMLDWDKPLSEQHPKLAAIGKELTRDLKGPFEVRKAGGDGKYYLVDSEGEWGTRAFSTKEEASKEAGKMRSQQAFSSPLNTGESFYQMLSNRLGGDKQASEYLKAKGIPGIRYLDATSRVGGEGTRNLVLFDPEIAKITKRE